MSKVIIAGSRGIDVTVDTLNIFIEKLNLNITEIVSGNCKDSPDVSGECWALVHGKLLKLFPADWEANGKAAGPIRNKAMAEYADQALVFWDGLSRGTKNMTDHMHRKKKPVHVVKVKKEDNKIIFNIGDFVYTQVLGD